LIEIDYAHKICCKLGISHKIVDLSNLIEIYKGVTSLVDDDLRVTSEFTKPIIVPFRNGVFMAVAVAHSIGLGCDLILYGAHASDEPFYPDCRAEFYKAFEVAARLGTERQIIIDAPFNRSSKASLIREAVGLGVPLELTWSCYLPGPIHCGVCESCLNRKKAFKEAEIEDPTIYNA
jgi:7-cyano-7-deazaguanine synthase